MARKKTRQPKVTAKVGSESPIYEVIEDAYRVFDFPKPQATGVCSCCMDRGIERDFYTPDIRDLPVTYVQDWYFAASDPDLSKSIWGYLLPRILEILAVGEDVSAIALEISLNRFPTGDKSRWSDRQWEVLDRFRRLYLEKAVLSDRDDLDGVICMFGAAGWPLEALFAQVLSFDDDVLVEKLWMDWRAGCSFSIWITAFWEKDKLNQVMSFYTARPLYERMLSYGMAEDTPKELSNKALDLADTIRMYASWRDVP